MEQLVQVDRIKKVRTFLLDIIKDMTLEELNKVPGGFANNVVWHLGHLVVAQQGICYLRTGLPSAIPTSFVQLYKSGTKPESISSAEQVDEIKMMLLSSLELLDKDLTNNLFANYTTWTTRYGVDINSIDDALQFLLFHEGLHSGYITYMKRLV